ncbi:MAG: helix-turn-helix domain-containing protein [Treponema sp.]|nr:helix-turn-helix domain-containing protein [Treponema sp.]
MANIALLVRTLSFIEDNLNSDFQTEDIARACYASKSSLEKNFREMAHYSVHDYVTRRKMMKAAKQLIQMPEQSILDVAVEYGFSSHEAFTRAFFNVWNCNPKDFREAYIGRGRVPELFPQITGFYQLQGENYMRRSVDISEMYDFLKERQNCYFVCADIRSLIPINNISRKAGDIALSETMKRLLDCSADEDVAFRIGHDEFALLTCSTERAYAEEIREKILAMNGQSFDFEGQKIPLNLYACVLKLESGSFKYADLFGKLIGSLSEEKKLAYAKD